MPLISANKVNKSRLGSEMNTSVKSRFAENVGKKGLKISRYYTRAGESPYADLKFDKRTSKITNPDGTVVFELKDVEVPTTWSQVATDILAQKYLRKKGVPQVDENGDPILDENGEQVIAGEKSAKQAMHRLAGTWRYWGEKYGYFETKEDAQAFEDEVKYTLMTQVAVPNSPQWFNTGLNWAYGITGESQGHYYVDPDTGKVKRSEDAYSRPQPHACFIQKVDDDLVNEGGIFDLLTKEARLFKYGSGTGTNFSNVRGNGESISGGGVSSGLMSFLKVLDAGAGSIQSGGTTRRAAKMVILDVDHPEVEDFIDWKVKEERKVASLVTGSHINHQHLMGIMKSAEENGLDPEKNRELKAKIIDAKKNFVPLNYIKRVLMLVENGVRSEDYTYEQFDTDFRSEAYYTVSGQNSNNSVRVDDNFMEAVINDEGWNLINRTDGKVHSSTTARDLWDKIINAAWMSADPGLQYHTTVNAWNTAANDGDIVGSNPCSEYMFLDETACNLYQINLIKFYDSETGIFDTEAFKHVVRISTIILEISVLMSQLPSRTMAEGTFKYRTLGLGYANLGTLIMQMGYPYDSEEGFAVNAAVTAIMGGEAYATSAEMASVLGTFPRYEANKEPMLRVIRNHKRAAHSADDSEYEELAIKPFKFKSELVAENLVTAAREVWDQAYELGQTYGYRNAHVTCLAPTGTSGLVMDCDTTGIEPDFALVKFKKLVGGGYFKIVNQSLKPALERLGYTEGEIKDIIDYAIGKQSLIGSPFINDGSLRAKGFGDEQIAAIETILPTVFELKYAFNKWTLGEEFCREKLGLSAEKLNDSKLDILAELGFTQEQIAAANEYICGTMTVEGAPHLKQEDYAVFDCANKCGDKGTRFIHFSGHIKQMAAAQPFLSGAISKTINMPEEATFDDVEQTYMDSWKLMIKATALYRDGSKLSQPLSTSSSENSVYAKLFNFNEEEEEVKSEIGPKDIQAAIMSDMAAPKRKRLATERQSITHKFHVAGHEGYLTVGLFDDGTPGELFITMSKDGSTLSGILNALALSISLNLQYGVPLETLVRHFAHVRFEPSGMTQNPEIPMAKSIIDYIGRWLGVKFLDMDVAKMYHTPELVEKAYAENGSNQLLKTVKKESLIKFTVEAGSQLEKSDENMILVNTEKMESKHDSFKPMGDAPKLNAAEFSKMQQQLATAKNNEDAPLCTTCGSVTIRNGACYKCPDCGTTTGCS
jgi:ribonucleoside-diphosphate reductase alpha chain